MQILLSACQISKFQKFYNFLKSHQPKGCFLSDRQKSPEFYLLKNVKKKKPIAVLKKKKERQRQPAPPTPKRSKKSIFDFCQFFLYFWLRLLDAVLMNTMFIVRKRIFTEL
jgi:hypothetical protein